MHLRCQSAGVILLHGWLIVFYYYSYRLFESYYCRVIHPYVVVASAHRQPHLMSWALPVVPCGERLVWAHCGGDFWHEPIRTQSDYMMLTPLVIAARI